MNLQVNDVIGMTIMSYSSITPTLNGTTECFTDENETAGYSCTTTGNQEVRTNLLPSQVDTTTMYSDILVSTNSTSGYTLELIDSDDVTSLTNAAGNTIVAVNSEPTASNPGWAIYTTDTTATSPSTWLAVPRNASTTDPTITAGTPIMIANYTPATSVVTNGRQSTVRYGVATAADQAVGVYSDTVVYTATVK